MTRRKRLMRLTLDHPYFALALLLASLATLLIAWRRGVRLPRASVALTTVAMGLLSLGAGGLHWRPPPTETIDVMVDCSASTRGADYRYPAALNDRISQLTGGAPYRVIYFAHDNAPDLLPPRPAPLTPGLLLPLPDLPGDSTRYLPPPDASSVLLFSDCQFDLPSAAPPTFVVVDPKLEHPADAAVTQMDITGDTASATVRNSGGPRVLRLAGQVREIGGGAMLYAVKTSGDVATAQLSPGDLWPENDRLSATLPAPEKTARWWIGANAPGGWTAFSPSQLPPAAADYLASSAIALNNIDAAALSSAQIDRLDQFVRDFGGTLLILGGDHAFGVGGYSATKLDALSPLASAAPGPAMRWTLLADSSGSMSAPASADAGASRFQVACDALVQVLAALPPADPVDVGTFSQDLRWWSRGKPAATTAALALPPPGAAPNGPTNFVAALRDIAESNPASLPTQLIVLTDADVQIDKPDELIELLNRRQVHLNVLAIGDGSGLALLQRICHATGGTLTSQFDPAQWSRAAELMVRQINSNLLNRTAITVQYASSLPLPARQVLEWNRTWQRPAATALASGHPGAAPLAAQWQAGDGNVISVAFAANAAEVAELARRFARPPRDPRFSVDWQTGRNCIATLNAVDGSRYLNGLHPTVDIVDASDSAPMESIPMMQSAPGRYVAQWPAGARPTIATLRVDAESAARRAIAGRYPEEFDKIGNDHAAMERVAQLSSGGVIWPGQITPIHFPGAGAAIALMPWLAASAALLVAMALAVWRLR